MNKMSADWEERVTTAPKAVWHIKSGDRVFVGTACGAPDTLVLALENQAKELRIIKDLQLIHFITDNIRPVTDDGQVTSKFEHKVFYVGLGDIELIKQGRAHYVPISLSHVPRLIKSGRMPIDVALVQTTVPDQGHVSLGISVDITKAAVDKAKMVIAEINPNMPWTCGDTLIPVDKIDHFVEVDEPVKTFSHPNVDEVAEKMARYIASIIDDGSTLQIAVGRYANSMLKYLDNRKDLGVHSDVICDEIVDLVEKGVITGKAKDDGRPPIVTSYCMGTKRLYDFVDRNPDVHFLPIEDVCNPLNISRNRRMVSVTQAFTIDLRGQVCATQRNGEEYGGVSTQPEFIKGAAASPGGSSIICLASTTTIDGQRESTIRPLLREDESVTIPGSDVHWVATEHGTAYLFAKSIRERALSLIEIADPEFQPGLLEEAKRLGYVRADQVMASKMPYPAEEERVVEIGNKETIFIRPTKPSDVVLLQELFYHLDPEDIVTRFFERVSSFASLEADYLYNVDYVRAMAFIAFAGEREAEMIIGNAIYYVDDATELAEFAYMVRPEWQGIGLGSALKQRMIEYARSKGVKGYYEDFLESNAPMKRLAEKAEGAAISYAHGKGRAETLFE